MNKVIRTLICIALFIQFGFSQNLNRGPLSKVLQQVDSSNIFMGNVSISKYGREIYQRSIGFSNLEQRTRNTDSTKFRIGSISKSFTAVMIMQLIESKKLTLSDKLDVFYPSIPNAEIISIEQLLRHKSGLFNITASPGFFTWMESYHTQKEIIDLIKKNGTVFKPGKRTEYSNTNYILLSFILEQIDNKEYADILSERILKPCGLENTYFGASIHSNINEAHSYVMGNNTWQASTNTDMSVPMGAGGIISTPTDLNSFYYQLFTGKLIKKSTLDMMIGNDHLYEYALYPVISFEDKVCYGHEGRIDGFHAYALYFPSDSIGLSFCTNADIGYLKDVLIQVFHLFNQPVDVMKTYVNEDEEIALIKLNRILLVRVNKGPLLLFEQSKKRSFQSQKGELMLKLSKNENELSLKNGKIKSRFEIK